METSPEIYLDRHQCNSFRASYWHDSKLSVRADILLESKWSGYDDYHRKLLKPLGSKLIVIRRESNDSPGWFKIVLE